MRSYPKKAHGHLEWAFIRIKERELSKSPDLKRMPLNKDPIKG